MNKKALAIGAFFILIFSFQNCSQNTKLTNPNEKVVDSEIKEVPDVVYPDQSEYLVITNDQEKSGINSGDFKLDIQKGIVIADTQPNYCLTENQQQELADILSQSRVCYPEIKEIDENAMCAMYYKYPYVTLQGPYFEVKLGEQTDSCDQPVDLCEEKSERLRGFISHILKNLKKQSCQFVEI